MLLIPAPLFLFYRKQFAFDSFIIPDTKKISSRFFAKEKRCRNLLTPQYLSIFSLKISAHKGFFVQWTLLSLQFVQTVCTNSILFPFLHYPAAEDKTLPFEFQSPLSVLLLSAGIICTWKQIIVHCRA